jgi:uncharacterized membrane protein SpoIIM required for sporulation
MDERAFVERRRPDWVRLAEILSRTSSSRLHTLSRDELLDLGKLYRRVTSDLSYVKANSANQDLIVYLNDLAGRAHGCLYSDAPRNTGKSIIAFLLRGFPILFRKQRRYIALAAAIMLSGAAFSAIVVTRHPAAANSFIPQQFRHDDSNDGSKEPVGSFNPIPATFSSELMVNNIKASLFAFVGGITFGLLTAWIILSNGLTLGAFMAHAPHGLTNPLDMAAFLLPHGCIELTSLCIAGAAGLMLGWSLIAPGNLTRMDSLRQMSKSAVPLFGGVVAMLIVAGCIESFVARSALPRDAKLTVAALSAVTLVFYFGFAGRGEHRG